MRLTLQPQQQQQPVQTIPDNNGPFRESVPGDKVAVGNTQTV
jgi:hypothetical protein